MASSSCAERAQPMSTRRLKQADFAMVEERTLADIVYHHVFWMLAFP